MKLKRFTSAIIAASICFAPMAGIQRANSNPAIIAPLAFCAGTAGVGCVLVGTAIVGGTLYYVWQNSEGKRVHANAYGDFSVEQEEDVYKDPRERVIGAKWKPVTEGEAIKECLEGVPENKVSPEKRKSRNRRFLEKIGEGIYVCANSPTPNSRAI